MLTIFSTPKPFAGHIDVIQRNAIRSWQRLHAEVEIILLGDDAGTAEVCAELGLRHIPEVRKNKYGTKYLASVYDQADEQARHEFLCHVNCDIILMSDFLRAARAVMKAREQLLMAGRRWDVDLTAPMDFVDGDWEERLRGLALKTNRQRPAQWIDYFFFTKGLYYQKIPEFVVGRPGWDNWLLWYAHSIGVPVVDASKAVVAVHQNHDYSYHPEGEQGVWYGAEAQENYRLYQRQYDTLGHASHLLCANGLRANHKGRLLRAKRTVMRKFYEAWFALLHASRPVRHRLGLRKTPVSRG